MKKTEAELKSVHASALGERLQELKTFDEVLKALAQTGEELPSVVQWASEEPQSIVLKSLHDETIHFYNPTQREGLKPGTVILEDGPVRKVVGSGLESLSVEDFRELFESGRLVCLRVALET